jgi:hypothetical protein
MLLINSRVNINEMREMSQKQKNEVFIDDGNTYVHIMCKNDLITIEDTLKIACENDVSSVIKKNKRNLSPFDIACIYNNKRAVMFYIQNVKQPIVDLSAYDNITYSILDYVCYHGCDEILDILLKNSKKLYKNIDYYRLLKYAYGILSCHYNDNITALVDYCLVSELEEHKNIPKYKFHNIIATLTKHVDIDSPEYHPIIHHNVCEYLNIIMTNVNSCAKSSDDCDYHFKKLDSLLPIKKLRDILMYDVMHDDIDDRIFAQHELYDCFEWFCFKMNHTDELNNALCYIFKKWNENVSQFNHLFDDVDDVNINDMISYDVANIIIVDYRNIYNRKLKKIIDKSFNSSDNEDE